MWIQAGFSPETFYPQTPLHFQVAMEGVRKRLAQESDARISLAHATASLIGAVNVGKLKNLNHYLSRNDEAQSPRDMLSMLKSMGANSNMTIKRVKRAND